MSRRVPIWRASAYAVVVTRVPPSPSARKPGASWLRAQHASSVPLLRGYGYVKDTIAILDQAKRLSGSQFFVVNWMAGIVHTELPGYFHQRKAPQEELSWCVEHADKAPHPAWLREVYFHLGKLALNGGDTAKAQEYCGEAAIPTSASRSR